MPRDAKLRAELPRALQLVEERQKQRKFPPSRKHALPFARTYFGRQRIKCAASGQRHSDRILDVAKFAGDSTE
jgi:hypothetical protein